MYLSLSLSHSHTLKGVREIQMIPLALHLEMLCALALCRGLCAARSLYRALSLTVCGQMAGECNFVVCNNLVRRGGGITHAHMRTRVHPYTHRHTHTRTHTYIQTQT